jgi:hypothetical protein
VLAGAVLGCGVAVLLYLGPIRSRIDRLADLLGGWLEALVSRGRAIGTRARH